MSDTNNDNNEKFLKKKVTLPDLIDLDFDDYDLDRILAHERELDSNGQFGDFDDLNSIHRQIQAARLALYKITLMQDKNDNDLTIAEFKYDSIFTRAYMDANLQAEPLKADVEKYKNLQKQLLRRSVFLKEELDILQTLSNDYRQMAKLRQ